MWNILDRSRVILACWGMGYDRTFIFDYQRSLISKTSAGPSVSHLIRQSLPNTMKGWKRAVNCGDGGMSSNCPNWSDRRFFLVSFDWNTVYLWGFGFSWEAG